MTPVRVIGLVAIVFVVSLPATYVMNHGVPAIFHLAAGAADEAEDTDDPVVDALCLKAAMFIGNDQYDKAIDAYTNAIRRDPKYSFAYLGRGDAYLLKGDLDRAILDYDQAIRLDPTNEAAKARAEVVRAERANR
ncbi:MAG TPA: tetratricopeptide repeat protein [Gemmataceae bacterium]|nr:tetratricopeptide repeat protein [Gemmataceae bacterium]